MRSESNLAIPLSATAVVRPASATPAGPVPIARVMVSLALAIRLPALSTTVTSVQSKGRPVRALFGTSLKTSEVGNTGGGEGGNGALGSPEAQLAASTAAARSEP